MTGGGSEDTSNRILVPPMALQPQGCQAPLGSGLSAQEMAPLCPRGKPAMTATRRSGASEAGSCPPVAQREVVLVPKPGTKRRRWETGGSANCGADGAEPMEVDQPENQEQPMEVDPPKDQEEPMELQKRPRRTHGGGSTQTPRTPNGWSLQDQGEPTEVDLPTNQEVPMEVDPPNNQKEPMEVDTTDMMLMVGNPWRRIHPKTKKNLWRWTTLLT